MIWEAVLDGIYQCQVERVSEYRGRLRVFHRDFPFEPLLNDEVRLAYGAPFGPDVSDVAVWQEKAAAAVDGQG